MKNVLVITAHPDDHFFCSGMILNLKKKGFYIKEIVLSKAELSGYIENGDYVTNPNQKEKEDKRFSEYRQAIMKLGIDNFELWDEPNLNINYNKELILKIIKEIRSLKPSLILTHSKLDYMRDHEKTAEIVLEAVRLASYSFKQDIGEPFTIPIFLNFEGMINNNPSILLDITTIINKKKEILSIYNSQISNNSWEYNRVLNRNLYLGSYFQKDSKSYAENYSIEKKWPLKIDFKLLESIFK